MKVSKIKINCTSISALISSSQGNNPPTEKQWKDLFNYINKPIEKITSKQMHDIRHIVLKEIDYNPDDISETLKKELYELYAIETYGKYPISAGGTKPDAMDKGKIGEPPAILLLSKIDGVEYVKNDRLLSNTFFKGKPDILISTGPRIKDVVGLKEIKVPYDYPSFVKIYEEPLSRENSWQMQGYMDILKLEESELVHCMVNMPDIMIANKLKTLQDRLLGIGIPDLEVVERCGFLVNNMTYDNIPDDHKIIRVTVTRNDARIKEAHARVRVVRKWIASLHDKIEKAVLLAQK